MKKERGDNLRDIKTNLKNRVFKPVYFFHGEEDYYIDELAHIFENEILSEEEKSFNLNVVYARDATPSQIADLARGYPMMGKYQVILVKEVQGWKERAAGAAKEKGKDKPKSIWDALDNYLDNPLPSTILCLCYKHGKFDKRLSIYKKIDKVGVIYESEPMRENEVMPWVQAYVKQKGYIINEKSAQLVVEHVGVELSKAVNELNKLFLNIKPGETITPELIEQHIGISKDFNVFELQKAIGRRDHLKAQQIATFFALNPKANSIHMLIPTLFSYFSKLALMPAVQSKTNNEAAGVLGVSPFFMNDYKQAYSIYNGGQLHKAFNVLHEFDLKSKGIGQAPAEEGDMLKEMLFKIMH